MRALTESFPQGWTNMFGGFLGGGGVGGAGVGGWTGLVKPRLRS